MGTYSISSQEPGREYDAEEIERAQLEGRSKSGARWFYIIGGLSLVTSIISLLGSNMIFLVSLGLTVFANAMAREIASRVGDAVIIVALVIDVLAAGVFILLGYFGSKHQPWAFIVGMVLYLLDSIVFLVFGEWLAVAFHAFALFSIFGGYRAAARLAAMRRASSAVSPPPPTPPTHAPGNTP